MSEQLNKFNVLDRIQELEILIEDYDKADRESDVALFAKHDPLKNVKQSITDKLIDSTGRPEDECQVEAEEIVNNIKQLLAKENIKNRICSVLKLLSSDLNNVSVNVVSGVLTTFFLEGILTFTIIPGLAIAIGAFIVTRSGIEFFCSENSENNN